MGLGRTGWPAPCRPRLRTPRWSGAMALLRRPAIRAGSISRAAPHLEKHAAFAWTKPLLRDLVAGPWTEFTAER